MGTWKFDPYHTQVEFSAKHLGMMTVRGHFAEVTVTGDVHPEQPERSKFEASINTASIRTHHEQRDKDLRSSNFLEIDKHPTMTFKSTKIVPAGSNQYRVTGDLTIKGVTKPVTFDAVNYGEFNDPNMGHRYSLASTISPSMWILISLLTMNLPSSSISKLIPKSFRLISVSAE